MSQEILKTDLNPETGPQKNLPKNSTGLRRIAPVAVAVGLGLTALSAAADDKEQTSTGSPAKSSEITQINLAEHFTEKLWEEVKAMNPQERSNLLTKFIEATGLSKIHTVHYYLGPELDELMDDQLAKAIVKELSTNGYDTSGTTFSHVFLKKTSEYLKGQDQELNQIIIAAAGDGNLAAVGQLKHLDQSITTPIFLSLLKETDLKNYKLESILPLILESLQAAGLENLVENILEISATVVTQYNKSNEQDREEFQRSLLGINNKLGSFLLEHYPDDAHKLIEPLYEQGLISDGLALQLCISTGTDQSAKNLLEILEKSNYDSNLIRMLDKKHLELFIDVLIETNPDLNKHALSELLNKIGTLRPANSETVIKAINQRIAFANTRDNHEYFHNNQTPDTIAELFDDSVSDLGTQEGLDTLHLLRELATGQGMDFHDYVRDKLKDSTHPEAKDLIKFLNRLEQAEISNFHVLNGYLDQILQEKQQKLSDDRPVAVVIGSSSNDAVFFQNQEIADLIDNGYRILYYEVSSEEELFQTDISTLTDQQAACLLILGHGSPEHLSVGGEDPQRIEESAIDEQLYLDTTDVEELLKSKLFQQVDFGTSIILGGCSNAKGDQNLKIVLEAALPDNKIYGSAIDYNRLIITFGEDGEILNCEFSLGDQ